MTKQELYQYGIELAREFLAINKLGQPTFMTYEEALNLGPGAATKVADLPRTFLRRVVAQAAP